MIPRDRMFFFMAAQAIKYSTMLSQQNRLLSGNYAINYNTSPVTLTIQLFAGYQYLKEQFDF